MLQQSTGLMASPGVRYILKRGEAAAFFSFLLRADDIFWQMMCLMKIVDASHHRVVTPNRSGRRLG
jgi:hypothetical protein